MEKVVKEVDIYHEIWNAIYEIVNEILDRIHQTALHISDLTTVDLGDYSNYPNNEFYTRIKKDAIRTVEAATGTKVVKESKFWCGDEESLHLESEDGTIWHVCYSDPTHVHVFVCNVWLETSIFERFKCEIQKIYVG